jgi:hypothetical protein
MLLDLIIVIIFEEEHSEVHANSWLRNISLPCTILFTDILHITTKHEGQEIRMKGE